MVISTSVVVVACEKSDVVYLGHTCVISTSVVVVACERLLVAAQLQQVQKETLDVVVERALKLLEQTAACD